MKRMKAQKILCPICEYQISYCQCLFSGSAHPDTSKRMKVVVDHLYLLKEEQIKHIQHLQSFWQTSYSDKSMNAIVEELKENKSRLPYSKRHRRCNRRKAQGRGCGRYT